MTKTQSDLLEVLKKIRLAGDGYIRDMDARGIRMTDEERFRHGTVMCRNYKQLSFYGIAPYAYNVKTGTFHALEKLGLVERQGEYVRAKI